MSLSNIKGSFSSGEICDCYWNIFFFSCINIISLNWNYLQLNYILHVISSKLFVGAQRCGNQQQITKENRGYLYLKDTWIKDGDNTILGPTLVPGRQDLNRNWLEMSIKQKPSKMSMNHQIYNCLHFFIGN